MSDSRFYKNKGPFSVAQIIEISGALPRETQNIPLDLWVKDVAVLKDAQEGDVSFCLDKYREELTQTKTSICFVKDALKESIPNSVFPLYTEAPLRAFSKVAAAFYPESRFLPNVCSDVYIKSKDCFIHPTASLGENVVLGPGVVIHQGAEISDNVQIGSHTIVGPGVVVGEGTRIAPFVSLFFTLVGKRVMIGPGTRIGQEGFGFIMDDKGYISIPQLGRVILEDGVEIGSNCTIDRGSLKDTEIGSQTRMDNLIHIAHNVKMGKRCIVVAQVGIAGSTVFGDDVIIGGQVGIADHLKIGSKVRIASQSGVMRDIEEGGVVSGSPAIPIMEWRRQSVFLGRLLKKNKLHEGGR